MALPTFRAAGAKVAGTTAGLAVTAPAGVATGDLEILVASTIAGGTCSISAAGGSAWTAMTGSPQDVTGGEKLYVWWRIRQAGDSDPSVSAASDHFLAARMAITTGTFDPTTPFELAQAGSETTSDTSFSFATTGSTAGADRLCFCICTSGFDSNTHQVPAMTNAQLGSLTGRFTNHNTSNGAGGGFGCTSGTKVVAGALGTFACTIVTASSKAYIAFAVRPIPPLLPDNETMIDDFNRADASVDAGAGATLWNAVNHRDGVATSNARVIGNQYGLLINDNTGIYSKFFMAADFDLTFDTPQVFPVPIEFCFCLQEVPGSTWDGYMIEFSNTGQWTLYRVTNDFADYAVVQQVTGLTHANGDSWWIRVRGSSIKVYQKAAAGVYTLRIDTTDATYTGLTGPISFATYNTLGRIDNIRGGPVLAGPPPDVKSGTDAGVGDEAGAVPAMGMFGSEAGVLAEAGSTSVLITRTETGAGDDVQGRTSFLTVTDAAVGVELGLVILPPVIITGTDVGAGVDVAALLRTALAQDSALGAEIGGMSYIPLVSDAGAGLDFAGLAALLAAIDSGIETDIGSLVLSVVGFDTGLGSEFGSIPARVLLGQDTGAGAELAALLALLSGSDLGAGAEAGLTFVAPVFVAGGDSGAGADAGSVPKAVIAALELGTSTEVGGIPARTLLGLDVGTALEAATVIALLTRTDTGLGAEVGSTLVPKFGSDEGIGSELGKVAAAFLAAVDAGNVAEAAEILTTISRTDIATSVEIGQTVVILQADDEGHLQEVGSVPIGLVADFDVSTGSEVAVLLAQIYADELGLSDEIGKAGIFEIEVFPETRTGRIDEVVEGRILDTKDGSVR